MPSTTSRLPTNSTRSSPLWSLGPPGVVARTAFPGPTALVAHATMRRLCYSALMMSSRCGHWWGRRGASPSPQPGWGAASTAWRLPFYLLDQKLTYHFQRNRPQEYFSLASPALAGAGAEDSSHSCHISVTHPVLCVGQKLHPKPPPQQDICRVVRPSLTLHRAISRPSLVFLQVSACFSLFILVQCEFCHILGR